MQIMQLTKCHFATDNLWIFSNIGECCNWNSPISDWSPEMCAASEFNFNGRFIHVQHHSDNGAQCVYYHKLHQLI